MDPMPSLSSYDLAAESGELLPDKEVLSILDLFVNLDLALDLAAPVDLAVAANANVAAPVDAAATANVLSTGSTAQALGAQATSIDQFISGDAIATAPQDASIDQSGDNIGGGTIEPPPSGGDAVSAIDDGPLLNVNVDVSLDADVTAPIAGAVAANANVAAPIDAAVAANISSVDSEATAVADQTAIINQSLDGVTAEATAEQTADITQ